MTIRPYTPSNYNTLEKLYKTTKWYDPETDARRHLDKQVAEEPESILLAFDDEKLVGTVSLLFTGRHGMYFRLIAETAEIRKQLLKAGEPVFKKHGYKEVHILAPEEDAERHEEYESVGFTKGHAYRWFWREL